jgi:lipoprotein-anchoring transpeptidase ErfK/SrfK
MTGFSIERSAYRVFSLSRHALVVSALAGGLATAFWCLDAAAAPLQLSADTINNADLSRDAQRSLSPGIVAKAQILLARANFSPGEIDAKDGENFKKALRAFAEARRVPLKDALSQEVWRNLVDNDSSPAIVEYQITEDDVKGPFVPDVPSKMEDMKDLPAVPYKSAAEALAEKFHMSEELLKSLNPESPLDRAGDTIFVASVASANAPVKASRVEISKAEQTVRAFDVQNKLVAFYPATVGSQEKPSPSGTLKVTGAQRNPNYRYNPEYQFKEIRSTEPFTIKPGPNNPVGAMWIGLSAQGYGIHGTPDPSKVSKAESHGCVRLTNWDADDLAKRVAKGTPVAFVGEKADSNARSAKRKR